MILSADVGFKNLGYTLWHKGKLMKCGCIITDKAKGKTTRVSDDNAFRSAQLALSLKDVIKAHKVQGIVGELPSGGALSAKAMCKMAMATAVISAVASVMEIPVEWTSPNDVKLAVCGMRSATKDEMMDKVRAMYDFAFPSTKTDFEHIADSVGAYLALRNGNLVKLFG